MDYERRWRDAIDREEELRLNANEPMTDVFDPEGNRLPAGDPFLTLYKDEERGDMIADIIVAIGILAFFVCAGIALILWAA